MGAFGRNRTVSTKHKYRARDKRTGKSTLNKVRSRGYGFAYGYVRTKPKDKLEQTKGRKQLYKVGVGIQGFVLENHFVEAKNAQEARSIGISKYLHPDKGYDHIQVTKYKK